MVVGGLGDTLRKTTFVFCVLIVTFLVSANLVFGTVFVAWGEVDVEVYVVALDGVGGHGVDNASRVAEGAFSTGRKDCFKYILEPYTRFGGKFVVARVNLTVNVTLVGGWRLYKEVVETRPNAVIVNCHGETILVPNGYTKEEWVDEIAEAMAYRNVTWVHTAGYPFFYYTIQGDEEEDEWGEDGFKRLMNHIGKSDTECYYRYPNRERDKRDLSMAGLHELIWQWSILGRAVRVQMGKPLYGPEFEDEIVLSMWGVEDSYLSGAVLRFTKTMDLHNFGFYVHIGTYQTYDDHDNPTDADYLRGYGGAAAAILTRSEKLLAEDTVLDAERAILKAQSEGRTKGLDEAKDLLENAKEIFAMKYKGGYSLEEGRSLTAAYPSLTAWGGGSFPTIVLRARTAKDLATEVTTPSLMEAYALPFTVLGLIGVVSAAGLVMRWRKNSKKEDETK